MECSCTINIDHEGGPDCYREKIVTARKKHRCYECFQDIQPGEQYEYVSGIWDGDPQAYKTCLDCKSIRDTFFDSWTYTQVWDDFHDNFYLEDIPESCISKLTPGSRDRVCEWIESGWEDEGYSQYDQARKEGR
ncbi:MAG: hypothetical protein DRH26_00705 [Deltaproteobacteria bacterium]|nr:MAG: hypothetical protein DRH26_00705 [Deltaproteobacteria bacterium]